MIVRPESKPVRHQADEPDESRTYWWCSDCGQRVDGPWHTCKGGKQ